jgi:hypothetical protein
MHDQDGMRAIGTAVAALAGDPYPRHLKDFTAAAITGCAPAHTASCTWWTKA